jgi:hypothetical protein
LFFEVPFSVAQQYAQGGVADDLRKCRCNDVGHLLVRDPADKDDDPHWAQEFLSTGLGISRLFPI